MYFNRYVVWKRCKLASNGGFLINHGSDLLLEGNVVNNSVAGKSFATPGMAGPYGRSTFSNPPPFAVVSHPAVPNTHPKTVENCSMGTTAVFLRGNQAHDVIV